MRKRFVWLLPALALFQSGVFAQERDNYLGHLVKFQQAVDSAFYLPSANYYKETATVEKGKNDYSYLWGLCGLIQAANEIEKATAQKGLLSRIMKIICKYYDPAPPAPGYASYTMEKGGGDRFYDDNQWIGIATMDSYFRTKEKEQLATGKTIYRYMMTGFDTVLGGGLYWQENKKISKNTCSNGPGIILAMQLYKATGEKPYLDTAMLLYNWAAKNLKVPNGLYWDNVSVKDHHIGKAQFSYNTGTMLQSALYLYEATSKLTR